MEVVDINVINVADALSTSIYNGKDLIFVDTATSYSWRNIKNTIEKANPKNVWLFLSHWDNDHYGNLFSAIEYCADHDIHIKELVVPTPPNNNKIQSRFNEVISKLIIKNYPQLEIENPINIKIDEMKTVNECLYKYLETVNGLHNREKAFNKRFESLSTEGKMLVNEMLEKFQGAGDKIECYREAQLEIFTRTNNQDVKNLVIGEFINPTIDPKDKDIKLFKNVQMFDFEKDLRREYIKRNLKGLPKELISTKITFIDKPKDYYQKTIHISNDITMKILRVNPELYNKDDKKLNEIDTKNNNSIVMCLTVGNNTFYLPGDCEMVLENAMEQIFDKGKATDFKDLMEKSVISVLAHHGLASATGYYALSHSKNVRIGISSIGREHGDDSSVKERCKFKVLSTYFLDDIHLTIKDDDIYIRSKEIHEQAKKDLKDEIASQKIREGDNRRNRAISVSLPRDFNALYELCKDEEIKTQALGIKINDKIFDRDYLINNPNKYEDEAFARFLIDEYNNRMDDLYYKREERDF